MAGSLTIDNINGKVISSSPVATESQVIGVGQTWQNVTASRAAGVTYTNSTGKPIMAKAVHVQSGQNMIWTVGGVAINMYSTQYAWVDPTVIIPNGATYSLTGGFTYWYELR